MFGLFVLRMDERFANLKYILQNVRARPRTQILRFRDSCELLQNLLHSVPLRPRFSALSPPQVFKNTLCRRTSNMRRRKNTMRRRKKHHAQEKEHRAGEKQHRAMEKKTPCKGENTPYVGEQTPYAQENKHPMHRRKNTLCAGEKTP